jgi:hypothetical protein
MACLLPLPFLVIFNYVWLSGVLLPNEKIKYEPYLLGGWVGSIFMIGWEFGINGTLKQRNFL